MFRINAVYLQQINLSDLRIVGINMVSVFIFICFFMCENRRELRTLRFVCNSTLLLILIFCHFFYQGVNVYLDVVVARAEVAAGGVGFLRV